jgi:type VI secretion system protein ImpI
LSTSILIVEVVDTERKVRQEYTFDRSPVRVGRSPLNDLPLERSFVSHCHGVLTFDGRHCEFVDLGSTNGTYLGATRLTKNKTVAVTQQTPLVIGDLELRVRHATSSRVETRMSYAFNRSDINHVLPRASGAPSPPAAASAPEQTRAPAHEKPAGTALPLDILAPLYVQYRLGWTSFFNALQQRVPAGADRQALAQELLGRFPELAQEAEFQRWLGTDRPSAGEIMAPTATGDSVRPSAPFTALTRALGGPVPSELESAALDRMAHVIERFAQTFLELRRGQRQFIADLSIPMSDGDPLAKLEDARSLVRYLLDVNAPPGRVDELSRAYADLMMHQVALLNGILAGAREVLTELSPDALATAAAPGPVGWLMRLVGRDARWSVLRRRFEDLQEEKALSSVVLGRMFARAYAAAMGQTTVGAAEPSSRERTGSL